MTTQMLLGPIMGDVEGLVLTEADREGFTTIPPMRLLGERWKANPAEARKLAHAVGVVIGTELVAHGLDFSFAPVLDLDWGGRPSLVTDHLGEMPKQSRRWRARLSLGWQRLVWRRVQNISPVTALSRQIHSTRFHATRAASTTSPATIWCPSNCWPINLIR